MWEADGFAAEAEVVDAIAGAEEAVGAVAERDQAEAVALVLGHQRQMERGVDVAFQNIAARGEARGIDDGVDFLGMLRAEELDHREMTPRGGLPVDVFDVIADLARAE